MRIAQASDFDLVGELLDEPEGKKQGRKVALKVIGGGSGETRWQ